MVCVGVGDGERACVCVCVPGVAAGAGAGALGEGVAPPGRMGTGVTALRLRDDPLATLGLCAVLQFRRLPAGGRCWAPLQTGGVHLRTGRPLTHTILVLLQQLPLPNNHTPSILHADHAHFLECVCDVMRTHASHTAEAFNGEPGSATAIALLRLGMCRTLRALGRTLP